MCKLRMDMRCSSSRMNGLRAIPNNNRSRCRSICFRRSIQVNAEKVRRRKACVEESIIRSLSLKYISSASLLRQKSMTLCRALPNCEDTGSLLVIYSKANCPLCDGFIDKVNSVIQSEAFLSGSRINKCKLEVKQISTL